MQIIFSTTKEAEAAGGSPTKKVKDAQAKEGAKYLADAGKSMERDADRRQRLREVEDQLHEKDKRIDMLEKLLAERPKTGMSMTQGHMSMEEHPNEQMYKDLLKQEENKKFAYAAQKTIQTLQNIIEDKNEQLARKEEIIKKMREEYIAHKTEDAQEIARLSELAIKYTSLSH